MSIINTKIEKAIVRGLLAHMAANGFKLDTIDDVDGGVVVRTEGEAMDLIFDLDSCTLEFERQGDRRTWVRINRGAGEPDYIVSDWGTHAPLDAWVKSIAARLDVTMCAVHS